MPLAFSSSGTKKIILIVDLIVLVLLAIHSIYRDIQLEKQYPGDLRNRIVGARLQKDGRSPYFYKWKGADGLRYMDPQHQGPFSVSNITASPFFHDLLMPICDLPQRTISRIWMWVEYISLAWIGWLFIALSKNIFEKILVLNVSVLFTCTEAWKMLIANGQLYLVVALVMTGFIYGLLRSSRPAYGLLAAICATTLVLLRPTAILVFIPFIFLFKKNRPFLLAAGICFLVYGLFVLLNPNEKQFWADYGNSVAEQVKVHQDLNPLLQKNEPLPLLTALEGFNFAQVKKDSAEHPIVVHSENGNVFVLYNRLTHTKIPPRLLLISFGISVALLTLAFVLLQNRNPAKFYQILLFAGLLYMLSDFFSPIYRHQYNSVQWLPLLLLGGIHSREFPKPIAILLLAGLLLNISNTSLIPMRHTLGEYLWLLSLFLIVFIKPRSNVEWKSQ